MNFQSQEVTRSSTAQCKMYNNLMPGKFQIQHRSYARACYNIKLVSAWPKLCY